MAGKKSWYKQMLIPPKLIVIGIGFDPRKNVSARNHIKTPVWFTFENPGFSRRITTELLRCGIVSRTNWLSCHFMVQLSSGYAGAKELGVFIFPVYWGASWSYKSSVPTIKDYCKSPCAGVKSPCCLQLSSSSLWNLRCNRCNPK